MSVDIFNIGLTGLNAAKIGLDTTGNNISNVDTPGYSRQEIVQSSAVGQSSSYGFVGHGTQVDTIARQYNGFLQKQVLLNQSQASFYDTYSSQISQLDNLIGDGTTGISPALQDFFNSVQDVANSPSSTSARQTMLSNAQTVVQSFQALDGQLQSMSSNINEQLSQTVQDINVLGTKIANLNSQIQTVTASSDQPPNDLLDQRDAAMQDLNKLVQASGTLQPDGSLDVYIGTGQSLVVGNKAVALTTVNDSVDPSQLDIAVQTSSSPVVLSSDSLAGGQLGGLLNFREQSLNVAQNNLGKLAVGFATTFNAQNSLGQDLNGSLGTNLFGVGQAVVLPNSANTGSGVVSASITDVNQLTASDYSLSVQGGQYQVTRLSDNVTQTFTSFPITVDGVALTNTSGTLADGDSFLIQPTRLQAHGLTLLTQDPAKIAAASPIQTSEATSNTGSASISAGSVIQDTSLLPLAAPITLTYDATSNTFTAMGGGTTTNGNPAVQTSFTYVSGSTVTLNGNMQFSISGTPQDGDKFTISANTNGTNDNRNALALGLLQTTKTMDQGTSTYQAVYSQMASMIGSQTRSVKASDQSYTSLLQSSKQASQSVSGVNLDEEAAKLLQYQQAYQAAGKLLQIASQLFQTVLSIGQ